MSKEITVVKTRTVMNVNVEELSDHTLRFMKNDEVVIIPMKLGHDNYRLVRQELLRKTNRRNDDMKSVGQYKYEVSDDYKVTIYNVDDEIIFDDFVDESELSYPRNYVINYILNNTK